MFKQQIFVSHWYYRIGEKPPSKAHLLFSHVFDDVFPVSQKMSEGIILQNPSFHVTSLWRVPWRPPKPVVSGGSRFRLTLEGSDFFAHAELDVLVLVLVHVLVLVLVCRISSGLVGGRGINAAFFSFLFIFLVNAASTPIHRLSLRRSQYTFLRFLGEGI